MEHLLEIICSKDEYERRKYVKFPWYANGFSYSTNGFCLLRHPGEYGVPYEESFSSVKDSVENDFQWDFLNADIGCSYLDLPRLKEVARQNPCNDCLPEISEIKYTRCKECGGRGMTECWHCGHEGICVDCEGDGSIIDKYPRFSCPECYGTGTNTKKFKVFDKILDLQMLLKLSVLPNLRFFPNVEICKHAVGFRFSDHGQGALMTICDQ